jgi:hypothetical protein
MKLRQWKKKAMPFDLENAVRESCWEDQDGQRGSFAGCGLGRGRREGRGTRLEEARFLQMAFRLARFMETGTQKI